MFGREDVEAYLDELMRIDGAQKVTAAEFLTAAASGNTHIVERYIRQHGDDYHWLQRCNAMNVTDDSRSSALLLAAKNNHVDIVRLLLETQLDVNARGHHGDTALLVAAAAGHLDVVEMLLADGRIETGPVNADGDTPLTVAINNGNVNVVKAILETGTLTSQYDHYIELLKDVPLRNFKDIRELLRLHRLRYDFRMELERHDQMSVEDVRLIHTMSSRNFSRLNRISLDLKKINQFNLAGVTAALHRVTESIPVIDESTREKTYGDRKHITLDGAVSFYMRPKKSPSFMDVLEKYNRNSVQTGYEDSACTVPKCGVKKLRDYTDSTSEDLVFGCTKGETGAVREVKYHRLLGRDALWFRNNHAASSVVYPWQKGKSLNHYDADDLATIPYARRLQWLASVMTELNILHQHYRVFGDIKVENIVLSLEDDRMSLIDFESTHKIGSGKAFPHMLDESQGSQFGPNKASEDMYGMSFPLQALFPEMLQKSYNHGHFAVIVQTKLSGLAVIEQAVSHLFHALTEKTWSDRCTSEQALNFCLAVLASEKNGTLDEASLNRILAATLNRAVVSVEDVLRESLRPMKFTS